MQRVFFYMGILTTLAVSNSFAAKVPKLLSQADLYRDIQRKEIDPKNLSYSPQYPLWSDGAKKSRWIALPEGTKIDTRDVNDWIFPVGTRLWKEFSFKDPSSGNLKRVETRLIIKLSESSSEGWKFYTYLWNKEETEAELDVQGKGKENIFPVGEALSHDVPNRTDCLSCHSHQGEPILGFSALQLSWDRDPLAPHAESPQDGMISLRELGEKALISHAVSDAPKIPASTREERAALGYLHANCGGCHSKGGNAAFTGMLLSHLIGNQNPQEEPAYATSVNQKNIRFLDKIYRIKGGDPESSAVIVRMDVSGRKFPRMPNIGPKRADDEALKLLRKWISDLPKP